MSIPGMSRPARSAGLALLAIAVISAVVGGIMLATGDGGGRVAGPSQSSGPGGTPPPGDATSGAPSGPGESASSQAPTSKAPGAGESAAPGDGAPGDGAPTSGPGEPGAGGTGGTGGTAGAGGTGANGGSEGKPGDTDVAVRVYNNSNIDNLASRAARDLRGQGWTVAEVSNYPHGLIPTTTAYYRKGTPERAAAISLAAEFGIRAEPRFDGISDASPGVIIIVTKDYQGPVGKSG